MNSEPDPDRFMSKRVADPAKRVFWRSPFLVPAAPGQDKKESDLDLASGVAILLIENYQWLGKVVHVNLTSKYDCLSRLIDLIVQFQSDGKIIPLGFEICLAQNEAEIAEEILALTQELSGGQEFAVKYFDSPSTGKRKDVRMPKVLWAWTFPEARELMQTLIAAHKPSKSDAVDQLKHHPLRTKCINRTLEQLRECGRAAQAANNVEYAHRHEELHNAIERQAREDPVLRVN